MRALESAIFFPQHKVYLDGEIVRLILRRRGIRQKTAAKLIRVCPAQFCQYLDGRSQIRPATLASLCQILKIQDPAAIIREQKPESVPEAQNA